MNMQETKYLLRSPKNASHLMESISQLRGGKASARELLGKQKKRPTQKMGRFLKNR